MYKGAKYIGTVPVRLGESLGGKVINENELVPEIQEWEAKARDDFEPVYSGSEVKKKIKKGDDNGISSSK